MYRVHNRRHSYIKILFNLFHAIIMIKFINILPRFHFPVVETFKLFGKSWLANINIHDNILDPSYTEI